MALMNNNGIQINSYLQNEMSAEERKAFETQLATDKELQYELLVQRQVIEAAFNAGLKAEFAKAIRQKTIVRRIFRWGIAACIIGAIIVLFNINQIKCNCIYIRMIKVYCFELLII